MATLSRQPVIAYPELHVAASFGDVDSIHVLIQRGAPVNEPRNDGKIPLMLAVTRNDPNIVQALLQHGADINVVDEDGTSALQMIFKSKVTQPQIIKQFLLALEKREPYKIIERLFNAGCTMYDATLLTWSRIAVMKGLLKRGVDVNSRGFKGRTALLEIVATNELSTIAWLLDNGADVNARDEINRSAVLVAAENEVVLRLLLERGADPNVKSYRDGLTPLFAIFESSRINDFFAKRSIDECIELLLQHGAVPSNKIGNHPSLLDVALCYDANGYRINLVICCAALRAMQGFAEVEAIFHCIWPQSRRMLPRLREYYESCKRKLKIRMFESLTLLDLLSASEGKIRVWMRNELFYGTVCDGLLSGHREIYKSYSYYYVALMNTLRKVPDASLEKQAILVVCKLFDGSYEQCYVFAKEVVGYLNKRDLEQLCKVKF